MRKGHLFPQEFPNLKCYKYTLFLFLLLKDLCSLAFEQTVPPPSCQLELSANYRGELDVYWVIKDEFFLQILQLLHMLALPGLHHVLKVKHSRLPAVQDDHGAEVWESEEG